MELKQILNILDLPEEIADLENPEDAFKEAVSKRYLTREQALNDKDIVSKVSGKFFGPLNTKLKQIGGLTHSDIEGKKIEDIIDMIGEKFNTEITTLKETATKGNDEKLNALTEELEKHKKTASKYKSDLDSLSTTYEQDKMNWQGELKNYKIKTLYSSELSKVKFKDDITPVEKEGYNTILSKKYKFDVDENDTLVVRDEKGEPIANPKKVGAYFTPYDVLELEAINNKVAKMNNSATTTGSTVKSFTTTSTQGQQQNNNGGQTRKLHPSAVQHAEVTNK